MKIGNTSFNLESLSNMTKDEFISRYAGKIGADINEAAKTLSKHFKKDIVVEVKSETADEDMVLVYSDEIAKNKKRKRK